MRKIKEVLRLALAEGRSRREIARSLNIGRTTVGEYLSRARAAGLGWPLPEGWDDARLEAELFPPPLPAGTARPLPDWEAVHRELANPKKKKTGVTLQLLWLEYRATHPEDGYGYSRFCELYRAWRETVDVVCRQPYQAGEKAFVDYAGQTVEVTDRDTGQVWQAPVFVGVLGASNYTYCEASRSRSLPDWVGAHVRMFEFWGGLPELLIPDNERAGVRQASYYEPDLNRTYHDLATHYGLTVLPTRPYKPGDKAKVESAVLNVERWVLAPLRHHTFFHLSELNRAMRLLLEALNDKPFQTLAGSRRSLFEELDRPALRPLPPVPYEYAEWKQAKVHIDYHIQVQHHRYSVPHPLAGKPVEARLTASTVEIFHRGQRVAIHLRSRRRGGYTTDPAHMPDHHRQHLEWTPERFRRWAKRVGPETVRLVTAILDSRAHPEQAYRTCLGLMRLERQHGSERLEAAARRAVEIGGLSWSSVKSILESGFDRLPLQPSLPLRLPQQHLNIRGPDYYRSLNHRHNNGKGH
ncbi:MAG: IS21 family transposase [Gemmatimonadetes bacterium]|nr:IS21 family transposase [Gemmatimonadota bacterium]NIT66385.1 IS21 family transposase [Gemmatimonadota bacterium]NIU51650.1 IS21 family transposase [Gemmatimonadota bacterium]NIV22942.1 IS21 family transposase [Gemmatimonadota bacterium]NIW74796.1 IS21 family transposase [Gemmatimonadota bacterium]